jgi:hypothetical protein
MRRLLLISLAAAVAAFGALVLQLMPRGGHEAETVPAQTTAHSPVRTVPTRPREATDPAAGPSGATGEAGRSAPADVSPALGELRTGDAAGDGLGTAITPPQVAALRAQAERRHVRPVTRMTFPIEPGTPVPPQVYLHPVPPELAGLSPANDPLGFIQVGDKFVLVGTVSRRIVAVTKG